MAPTQPGGFRFSDTVRFLGGQDPLAARTPARFRERVLAAFRAPANVAYLRGVLAARTPPGPLRAFALATLEDAVLGFDQGGDLLDSDPLAQRGGARPATGLWAEVRRLNLAFFTSRMRILRDKAALIERRSGDGQWDDDEPYHVRMLIADSLSPPGLESLNGQGPLHGILEDQRAEPGDPGMGEDDWAWDSGDASRTPEQAVAAYWGDDGHVESTVVTAATNLDVYGRGESWRENGGTRAMRYPKIPIWQNLSRGREYDRDIDETLGDAPIELGSHVRRWNLDRVRNPRGEEYRLYGHRAGDV